MNNSVITLLATFEGTPETIEEANRKFRDYVNSFPIDLELELTNFSVSKYIEDEEVEDQE